MKTQSKNIVIFSLAAVALLAAGWYVGGRFNHGTSTALSEPVRCDAPEVEPRLMQMIGKFPYDKKKIQEISLTRSGWMGFDEEAVTRSCLASLSSDTAGLRMQISYDLINSNVMGLGHLEWAIIRDTSLAAHLHQQSNPHDNVPAVKNVVPAP